MLWYKSWLETRWRFLIGLALLILSAVGLVLTYPQVVKLLPLASSIDTQGEIGRRIREAAELQGTYRGFIWSQWFGQNLPQTWTLLAVLIGTGGLLSQTSGGAALYTLSLPASRNRILGVRAATGLAEVFLLAFVPSLLIPIVSPAVGQRYSIVEALVHAACLFLGGSVFFSLAFLLSTVFIDVWRPALLAIVVAAAVTVCEQFFEIQYGLFGAMSAQLYFRAGALPWSGLVVGIVLSAAMLYGATLNIAKRDF